MKISIFIRAGSAAPIALEVEAAYRVARVKGLIEDRDGIHPQRQRLSFAVELLEDCCTLSDYGIRDGASLSLQVVSDRAALLRVMGLPPVATEAEIQSAHRRLAKLLHPDRTSGDRTRFQSMQDAYELLTASAPATATDSGAPPEGAGADWLPGAAHDEWTENDHALYEAVWRCDVPACLRLLAAGAQPDAYQNDQWGGTTLMLAAHHFSSNKALNSPPIKH